MDNASKDFRALQTPFFLVNRRLVEDSIRRIQKALDVHWPNSVLSFSVKTNSMPEVLSLMAQKGVWAEVVSDFELEHALRAGFSPSHMVCNGASKSVAFIRKSLANGSLLHLDSLAEVKAFLSLVGDAPCSFGVRINATEPDFDAEPLSGPLGSRFGLSVRDGDLDCLRVLLDAHPLVKLTSLHLHCNTRSRGLPGYACLSRLFARVVRDYRLVDVNTFDIGGSFGHDFDHPNDGEGHWPSWNEYLAGISAALRAEGHSPEKLRLVIEPGSSLISGCVCYLARIVGERTFNGKRVLQMDGSRVHIDPHFARSSFVGAMSCCRSGKTAALSAAVYVGGATCLEKDRIDLDASVANAQVGDLLVFEKTGAYSYGLSPLLFINEPPRIIMGE